MVEPENDYISEEIFESIKKDGCKTSMYIFEEGEDDLVSQENVVQTWAFVNKSKNSDSSEKDKVKYKEKDDEKECEKRRVNNT